MDSGSDDDDDDDEPRMPVGLPECGHDDSDNRMRRREISVDGRLAEDAELYAAAVFSSSGADLVADAIDLVSAIDWVTDPGRRRR